MGEFVTDLRGMWAMLRLSPWRVAVAIAWGVLALGSGLALAALAAWLIARAWQMPPVLDLTVAVVAVRALGISRGLCRYLERLATHDVALRAMTTARTSTYRTLARSNLWIPRRNSSPGASGRSTTHLRRGDLLVRVGSDIDDLGAVVVRSFVPIAVAAILSIAAVVLLGLISVAAAAILAVALIVSGVLAPWLSARAAAAAERAVRADRAEFTAQALTVLDHAPELRVAGRLDDALAAAATASKRAVAAEDAAASRSAWSAAATPLSIGASVLGALLIGITLYGPDGGGPGAMTPMALTILVLLPLSAFEAVGPLPAAAQTLTTARAALHRLNVASDNGRAASDNAPDNVWPQPASNALSQPERGSSPSRRQLESLESPSRRHPGPTAASTDGTEPGTLPGPVTEFPARPDAQRIAIVGPSGAGKTTLLMAWAGLFGTPVPGVTFFAEDAHLFGTSVLENLRVARGDLTAEEGEQALRAVGAGPWLDSLPDGIHTDLVGGAAAVSGGQRRRILLARALISPARVLLLDEPTEHLEAEAGADLLRALLDAHSGLVEPGRTVVVVTHQLPPDHRADLVLHVDASGQVSAVSAAAGGIVSAPREIPLPTS
ncbi:thiol reductant ABC exporter subunit CydC [Nocardia cyriacigeorgica]|uniref:thiol reductant ABC exporter subunit CydC n=1 Tax=Nocardia cyriacigeorgica TaxID=135487 RepID=UPI002491CC3F|nr:thiol reductant ABC exporter subunit CydC [Nocardia cyriacigeorgica]BDU04337.1 thiol reductant ABC exporter subunit CydC [Nocardia cyriacigeorgica]